MNKPHPLRRAVTCGLLAAVLGLLSLTLTQCTMVNDNVTKVNLTHGRPTSCERQCDEAAKVAAAAEFRRHLAAVAACNRLPTAAERQACRNAENNLFFQNLRTIYNTWQACRASCPHDQGGSDD
jgi:hypothetical protein